MKKIDLKNKTCIYLDQFVISDIMEGSNPLWLEIKELLIIAYRAKKIYCPLSSEHIIETFRKDLSSAKIHDDFLKSISDSYFMKSEPFLTAQLISSLIRKNNKTLNTFLIKSKFNNIENSYDSINMHHDRFYDGMKLELSPQNNFRKIIKNKFEKQTENIFTDIIIQKEVRSFIERLQEYLNLKRIKIRADNFGQQKIPNWIDQLLYQLTNKHKFKEKDFKLLLSELKNYGYTRIPTLHTKFLISTYLAVKGKQENSGDHIDIMRISSYLFSSDIFFTDKKRKHEISQLELDKKYNTLIFSGTEKDLKEFILTLKNIIEHSNT